MKTERWTISTIPRHKAISRFLKLYKLLGDVPIVSRIIFMFLKHRFKLNFAFSPGFSVLYNNLQAKNTDLGNCVIFDYSKVTIGEGTVIGQDCKIITSSHDFYDFDCVVAKPINIGKNCWLTTNVIVLQGVTIGDKVVVGANSVVTRDLPSNAVYAGAPAKLIRKLK